MIIENIGLLDESYFMYVKDLDYSYRVWKAGYKLYDISNAMLYHKVAANNYEEVSKFSVYLHCINCLKFRKKIKSRTKRITAISLYVLTIPLVLLKLDGFLLP